MKKILILSLLLSCTNNSGPKVILNPTASSNISECNNLYSSYIKINPEAKNVLTTDEKLINCKFSKDKLNVNEGISSETDSEMNTYLLATLKMMNNVADDKFRASTKEIIKVALSSYSESKENNRESVLLTLSVLRSTMALFLQLPISLENLKAINANISLKLSSQDKENKMSYLTELDLVLTSLFQLSDDSKLSSLSSLSSADTVEKVKMIKEIIIVVPIEAFVIYYNSSESPYGAPETVLENGAQVAAVIGGPDKYFTFTISNCQESYQYYLKDKGEIIASDKIPCGGFPLISLLGVTTSNEMELIVTSGENSVVKNFTITGITE